MANMKFLSVAEFKSAVGISSFTRTFNAISGKWFLKASNGKFYKCQQDLDTQGNLSFIYDEDETIDEACLINTTSQWEEHETF